MSLDRFGFISPDFESRPHEGVTLRIPARGDYTGPGGTWEEGRPETITLRLVNIQPAGLKTVETLSAGGTLNPQDWRVLHINDGHTYLYPDDTGKFAHILEFSDGLATRQWRVRQADNRPDRNFCRVVVERYRGDK